MELKYLVCDFNELLPKILEYKITLDKKIQSNLHRHAIKSPTWRY